MKHRGVGLTLGLIAIVCGLSVSGMAQQAAVARATTERSGVPRVVNYSGSLTDLNGKPLTGITGVTFLLYKEAQGGAPLWMETQNVQPNKSGHYTVTLGSASSQGLPEDVFVSGEARWLGVHIQGQEEQPRVLLVAVPYAMKARDAETIGGLPPSAFVLAAPTSSAASESGPVAAATGSSSTLPPPASTVTTTGGTAFTISMFNGATSIGNSIMTQTGTTAINVGGTLNLPATGTATAAAGKKSQAESFVTSVFNSFVGTAVPQTFLWRAEPANNNTAGASGTLNLLFAPGTAVPAETGLKINSKGRITFAAGQIFPGTGPGTVTSVGTGLGLTGGPITSSGTLKIDTSVVPQLAASNTFTGDQTVKGNLLVSGGTISVGGSRALSCTRSCAAIGSIPNNSNSAYSTGAVAAPAGYSLTGCSAYWAVNSSCSTIAYPAAANIAPLDDGAGACHALGYNGSGGTLESCACVTACQLP